MANPFTVQPLGGLQNVQMIGQGMQGIAQNVQADREEQRRQQLMQQADEVFQRGNPREIAQFSLQNPEVGEALQQAFSFSNEQTKPIVMDTYQRALADPDNAVQIMQQGIDQVASAGGRPEKMTQDLMLLQQNPEAGLRNIEMGFAASAPDVYDKFFGQQPEQSDFIRDMRAAGIDPKSPRGQELFAEKYGKGQTIGYDVIKAKNPETGEMEWAQVSRVNPGEIRFLGAGTPTDLSAVEQVSLSGGFENPAQARQVLNSANSSQAKAGGYAARLAQANAELSQLEDAGVVDSDSRALQMALTPSGEGFFSLFEAGADEIARRNLSPEEQQYLSQATEFVRAALRQESGAVIGADEARAEIKKYFPMPGDNQSAIESKRRLRERKVKELANQSGGTFDAQMYLMNQGNQAGQQGQQQGGIMSMNRAQLNRLNPADMTDEELQQAAERYEQLGAQ